MVDLRADNEIDRRCAPDDLLPRGLSDAARNGDRQSATRERRSGFKRPDAAEFGIHFLYRLLANMAGVEDDEVGVPGVERLGKALGRQRVRHTMGIVDVHLAAEGFYVELVPSGHALGCSRPPSQLSSS